MFLKQKKQFKKYFKKKQVKLQNQCLFIKKKVCRALYKACSTTKTSINLTSL